MMALPPGYGLGGGGGHFPGYPGGPVAGGFGGMPGFAPGSPPSHMGYGRVQIPMHQWLDLQNPSDAAVLDIGDWNIPHRLIEIVTLDHAWNITGTALFEITGCPGADATGLSLSVVSRGASVMGLAMQFSRLFPVLPGAG